MILSYIIFSLASSKLSASKYTGWYSVIGYFCSHVLDGSKGFTSAFPSKQYCSSPYEDSKPAPYALNSLFSLHNPYSTVNQNNWEILNILKVCFFLRLIVRCVWALSATVFAAVLLRVSSIMHLYGKTWV